MYNVKNKTLQQIVFLDFTDEKEVQYKYSTLTRNETVKTHNVRRQTNNQIMNKIMIVCAF